MHGTINTDDAWNTYTNFAGFETTNLSQTAHELDFSSYEIIIFYEEVIDSRKSWEVLDGGFRYLRRLANMDYVKEDNELKYAPNRFMKPLRSLSKINEIVSK